MPEQTPMVKKSTMYLVVGITFLVGFLSGVVYTVYNGPDDPGLANPSSQESELAAAIASLEQETRTSPDNVQAWIQLGHAYFDSDQYSKAIDAYTTSLRLNPGDTNIMTDLGVMYRRSGDSAEAIATFDKVLAIDPGHEQAMFNKGVVLLNDFKDVDGALAQWRELVRQYPEAKAPSGTPLTELIEQFSSQQ